MILMIIPCEKHKKESDKETQQKCKDCKKEYTSFI